MSSHYARNQRYMNQLSGVTAYNDPAYQPVAGHSLNGELYYRFRPVSWLELQPGLQVLAPSGRRRADPGRVGGGVENGGDFLIVAILITFFSLVRLSAQQKLLQCGCWIATAAAGKT